MIFIYIILIISISMIYIGFEKRKSYLFQFGSYFLISSSIYLGSSIEKRNQESKHIITPKVHVVCDNGKCDTTYIYRFKTK